MHKLVNWGDPYDVYISVGMLGETVQEWNNI